MLLVWEEKGYKPSCVALGSLREAWKQSGRRKCEDKGREKWYSHSRGGLWKHQEINTLFLFLSLWNELMRARLMATLRWVFKQNCGSQTLLDVRITWGLGKTEMILPQSSDSIYLDLWTCIFNNHLSLSDRWSMDHAYRHCSNVWLRMRVHAPWWASGGDFGGKETKV